MTPPADLDGASAGLRERDVVFVGGTGRSGTHILGRLLGSHPRYADVPIEARFHTNPRGLPDLVEGRVTLAGFLKKLREFWWHRVRVDRQPRGLYNLMTQAHFDAAVARFAESYHGDPLEACRRLFCDLLWVVADEERKPGLVEMSSHTVKEAMTLNRLFPHARFVHTVRDGRDAASSVTTKTWGPNRIVAGIDWWADRLRAIDRGMRGEEDGAPFALPEDRVLVVLLDDLVVGERDRDYGRLLAFLDADDAPAMRQFFERRMSPDAANRGRWREGLGRLGRARVTRKYERTLQALEREGNHVAGPLTAAYERSG